MSSSEFVPYGDYLKIIAGIADYKILDASKILEASIVKISYQSLMRKLSKLESVSLVQSFRRGKLSKQYFLSDRAKKIIGSGVGGSVELEYLNHGLATSRVVWELLKYSNFKNGNSLFFNDIKDIDPDAILRGKLLRETFKLAIEIELTQKSYKRVFAKFSKYESQILFDYTLYITQKKTLFLAYQEIINSMNSRVKDQIVLIFEPCLIEGIIDFDKSLCFYRGKETTFTKLFNLKKVKIYQQMVSKNENKARMM